MAPEVHMTPGARSASQNLAKDVSVLEKFLAASTRSASPQTPTRSSCHRPRHGYTLEKEIATLAVASNRIQRSRPLTSDLIEWTYGMWHLVAYLDKAIRHQHFRCTSHVGPRARTRRLCGNPLRSLGSTSSQLSWIRTRLHQKSYAERDVNRKPWKSSECYEKLTK